MGFHDRRAEATFSNRSAIGVVIVDGRFANLEFAGLEDFHFDGLVDGAEVAGGGLVPSVECLPPDVDLVSSLEALGLAVEREVVLVLVGDDLRGEGGR